VRTPDTNSRRLDATDETALGMYEVRRTADSPKGESEAKPEAEQSIAAAGASSSGWRRNVRKHKHVNQGSLSRCRNGAAQESEFS
jgi:hypothetical protein